jgi:hypothetical protein
VHLALTIAAGIVVGVLALWVLPFIVVGAMSLLGVAMVAPTVPVSVALSRLLASKHKRLAAAAGVLTYLAWCVGLVWFCAYMASRQ